MNGLARVSFLYEYVARHPTEGNDQSHGGQHWGIQVRIEMECVRFQKKKNCSCFCLYLWPPYWRWSRAALTTPNWQKTHAHLPHTIGYYWYLLVDSLFAGQSILAWSAWMNRVFHQASPRWTLVILIDNISATDCTIVKNRPCSRYMLPNVGRPMVTDYFSDPKVVRIFSRFERSRYQARFACPFLLIKTAYIVIDSADSSPR